MLFSLSPVRAQNWLSLQLIITRDIAGAALPSRYGTSAGYLTSGEEKEVRAALPALISILKDRDLYRRIRAY